jgi:hypothetical protein
MMGFAVDLTILNDEPQPSHRIARSSWTGRDGGIVRPRAFGILSVLLSSNVANRSDRLGEQEALWFLMSPGWTPHQPSSPQALGWATSR